MGGQGGGGFDAGKCILGQINGKIDDLGREQREIENLEVELKEGINTLKKENAVKVEGHKKKIEEIGKEIYKLFKVNFSLLTDNGRNKVIEFTLGKLGIRTSRSVWTKNIELLKKTLKGLRMDRFLRIKEIEDIDRIAIANDPDSFKGLKYVSITKKEVFFVKSYLTEKEFKKDLKKTRLN